MINLPTSLAEINMTFRSKAARTTAQPKKSVVS